MGWLSLLGKSPEESLCDWFCFRGTVEAGLVRLGSSGSVHVVTQRRPVLFSLPRTFLRVGFLFSRCEKLSNEEWSTLVFQERYWTSKMRTPIRCSTEALMIPQDSGQGKHFTSRHADSSRLNQSVSAVQSRLHVPVKAFPREIVASPAGLLTLVCSGDHVCCLLVFPSLNPVGWTNSKCNRFSPTLEHILSCHSGSCSPDWGECQ